MVYSLWYDDDGGGSGNAANGHHLKGIEEFKPNILGLGAVKILNFLMFFSSSVFFLLEFCFALLHECATNCR